MRRSASSLGSGTDGSQSFNQSLAGLVKDNLIDLEDALAAADSPDELRLALRGITKGTGTKRMAI